jgi:hypothetical protein
MACHGIFVAPVEQLSEPSVVIALAPAAERRGFASVG